MPPLFPTPDFPRTHDYDRLYEPSEDSFLVLDTLSLPAETSFLSSILPPTPFVVDLGTGSGILLTFVLKNSRGILGREAAVGLGVDVNPEACRGARETLGLNGGWNCVAAGVVRGNLLSAVRPRAVDVLLFNPPYVPTDSVPEGYTPDTALELAWAGGKDGMEVTSRVLDSLDEVLSERGVAYVVVCKGNKVEEIVDRMRAQGWGCIVAGHSGRKAGWEVLSILRIWRTQEEQSTSG